MECEMTMSDERPGKIGGDDEAASLQADPPPDPLRAAQAVYVISVAAELAGIHPQTLRIYERKGLLEPARTGGGSRRYSERDLQRLRRIQDLTAAGLNLEGARKVMELEEEIRSLKAEIQRLRAEAREEVARTHRQYRRDLVPLSQAVVLYKQAANPWASSSKRRG